MRSGFAVIKREMARLGRQTFISTLQAGIPADRVNSVLGEVGLTISSDLEQFYYWHNGMSDYDLYPDLIYIFPGFFLLSIEMAIAEYHIQVADSDWGKSWFPVLADSCGDCYFTDLNDEDGCVKYFSSQSVEQPVVFESLTEMVMIIAEAYEHGLFYMDGDCLDMDYLSAGPFSAQSPEITWRHK